MDHSDVYIGADHDGYHLKQKIEEYLEAKGVHVVDLGVFQIGEQADYADIAREVVEKIRENPGARGILVSNSGVGMCMTANRHPGIRAICCVDEALARKAREENDANVICLGGEFMDEQRAFKILNAFFETEFSRDAAREDRLKKIDYNHNPHAG